MYNDLSEPVKKRIRQEGNMQFVIKMSKYGVPAKFEQTPFRFCFVNKRRNSRTELFEFELTDFKKSFFLSNFRLSDNIGNKNALPQIEFFLQLAIEDVIKHTISMQRTSIVISTKLPLLVAVMADNLFKISQVKDSNPPNWRGIWLSANVLKRREELKNYEKSKIASKTRMLSR